LHVFNPEDTNLWCKNIEVSHNYITRAGCEYKGGVAIHAPFPTAVKILHNEVWDLAYSGIIMGWYGEPPVQSALKNNLLRANYVWDCMLELRDGGEIYTQAPQPGTIIDSNICAYYKQAQGNFFYIDVGSAGMTIKHNATIGISFTIGLGYACGDLLFDSNWCEWSENYISNNGTPLGPETNVYVTNMFSGSPPQALRDNAGPKEIELTTVSALPRRDINGKFSPAMKYGGTYLIYDMKGRLITKTQSVDIRELSRSGKNIPSGAYLIRREGVAAIEKHLVL
jgi:hypothetical protein